MSKQNDNVGLPPDWVAWVVIIFLVYAALDANCQPKRKPMDIQEKFEKVQDFQKGMSQAIWFLVGVIVGAMIGLGYWPYTLLRWLCQ